MYERQVIYLDEECCRKCRYFHQHYIYDTSVPYVDSNHGFIPIYGGHCVRGRIKSRKPNDTCEGFQERTEERR